MSFFFKDVNKVESLAEVCPENFLFYFFFSFKNILVSIFCLFFNSFASNNNFYSTCMYMCYQIRQEKERLRINQTVSVEDPSDESST